MKTIDGTAAGRYSCGCKVGVMRLGHGIAQPMPFCSRHGSGYGFSTVLARKARAVISSMRGALHIG